jgi:hypothetical protein
MVATSGSESQMTDAFSKLSRAKTHRSELETSIGAFRARSPHQWKYLVDACLDSSLALIRVVADVKEDAPRDWGLIVGDVLTNLRAALDHAVFSKASARLRLNSKQEQSLSFPIVMNEQYWPRYDELLQPLLGPAILRTIYDKQPFRSADPANQPLALLSRLVNADKHRSVQVVSCVSTGLKVVSAEGLEILQTLVEAGPITHGKAGAHVTVRKPNPSQVTASLEGMRLETRHSTVECVGLPGLYEARPVLEVFDGCIKTVEHVLEALSAQTE